MPPAPGADAQTISAIRILPPLVVNQIAAGEVVERPASVVKELVDNAIDAGATHITVELEQGGVELVRVADNGHGIPPEQLALAIAPHATSKIRDTADLDRIATMGFRGEALASIASVSRLSIRSRTADQAGAVRLDVEGDQHAPVRPEAGPVGTAVTVRNLFFNTPARRKFLRTATTEQGHCVDIVRDLALAHPHIGFTLRCDGRTTLDLPPNQGPRERALAVIGPEMESQYLVADADQLDDPRGISLWALVGLPVLARPTAKWQHMFLNGRPIRDRTVQHALKEAYRGLIEPGRQPAAVLMIEMDPGAVDVNVHPAKAEVRFRDSSAVHRVVYLAIRDALQRADLMPRAADGSGIGSAGGWRFEPTSAPTIQPTPSAVPGFSEFLSRPSTAPTPKFESWPAPTAPPPRQWGSDSPVPPAGPAAASSGPAPLPTPVVTPRVLQVHNSFLVTQDEHGVVIIDQHALHERVMFEKLRQRLAAAEAGGAPGLESQSLLVPAVLPVPAQRLELLERLTPLLTRLGISAAPLGEGAVGIQSFPTFLFDRKVDPVEFLGELLDRAEAEPETFASAPSASGAEAALHEVLDMMACKAAVKAGDQLSGDELTELLAMREQFDRASNCPHGRPTSLRLTIRELERQFGRS